MATLQTNDFTEYSLSPEELEQGQILNYLQRCVIQNLLVESAMKKTRLLYTPNDVNLFLQREAEIHGELGVLRAILSTSDEAEQAVRLRLSGYVDRE